MSHIMLDLETLGTWPGSAIVSIGAVVFSPADGLGATFSRVISTRSCYTAGLSSDPDTMKWWDKQEPRARAVLAQADCTAAWDLRQTLIDFGQFIDDNGGYGRTRIWGNGADFDNALIAAACRAVRLQLPWRFYNSRCYRTLKALAPAVTPPERQGIHHNSLDDATFQATHAIAIMKHLTPSKEEAQRELSI